MRKPLINTVFASLGFAQNKVIEVFEKRTQSTHKLSQLTLFAYSQNAHSSFIFCINPILLKQRKQPRHPIRVDIENGSVYLSNQLNTCYIAAKNTLSTQNSLFSKKPFCNGQ